jgi:hypothetical protein
MKSDTEIEAILRFCLNNLRSCNVGIIDESDIEMVSGGMIQLPSFTKIGSGDQVILRLFVQKFESM